MASAAFYGLAEVTRLQLGVSRCRWVTGPLPGVWVNAGRLADGRASGVSGRCRHNSDGGSDLLPLLAIIYAFLFLKISNPLNLI